MGADRDNRGRLLDEARAGLYDADTIADILKVLALANVEGGKNEPLAGTSVLWLAEHLNAALEQIEQFTNLTVV